MSNNNSSPTPLNVPHPSLVSYLQPSSSNKNTSSSSNARQPTTKINGKRYYNTDLLIALF